MKAKDVESAVKQRVTQAMKACGVSVNRLATVSGISQRTLNDQINGCSKLSADTLSELAKYRQDLSAEWLLRGKGEMIEQRDVIVDTEDVASLKEMIRRQQREIDGLYERIAELKGGASTVAKENARIG